MNRILLVLLCLVSSSAGAGAQTLDDFAGDWQGAKDTTALVELRISKQAGRWLAHAFGACRPQPCDWGVTPFTLLQQRPEGPPAGVAVWRRGTSTRFVTLHMAEGVMVAEIYNLFSGPRDQPSFLSVDTLTKAAPPTRTQTGHE